MAVNTTTPPPSTEGTGIDWDALSSGVSDFGKGAKAAGPIADLAKMLLTAGPEQMAANAAEANQNHEAAEEANAQLAKLIAG